jgi:TRAP-type mannitol/chloroaromatic compound transport system permease small subunit
VKALLSFSRGVDRLSVWIGQVASVAMLAACVVSCGNALSRYSLSITSNFWLEIQWYLFGAMFMLGAAYTLRLNEHVRVDLVYGMLKPRTRLFIDILGTLFFLIPTCAVGGWLTFWFFWDSWQTGEQAANAVGLPRWPAKLMFPLGFGLLLMQAISELIKRFEALTGHVAFDTSYEKPVQ